MTWKDESICKNFTWESSYGQVHFLEGENGAWANSSGAHYCPFNRTNADGPVGLAECVGDLISQSEWLPRDNCGSIRDVSDLLTDFAEANVSDENVIEITEEVAVVTSNTDDIESGDISKIAEIITMITNISGEAQENYSEKVTESVVAIVSNIVEVDNEILSSSEEGTLDDIVAAFEEQISNIPVQAAGADESVNIQQPKVAVKVQGVPRKEIQHGIVLTVRTDSADDLSESETKIQTSKDDDDDQGDDDDKGDGASPDRETLAVVNIPPELSEKIAPQQLNATNYVNVFFVVFSDPSLFVSKTLKNESVDSPQPKRAANTPVISLSVGEDKIDNLTNPINFTFSPLEPKQTNPSCVFWKVNDEGVGDWSNEGCQLLSVTGIRDPGVHANCHDPTKEKIVCGCNHLTNFAVLMDVYREDRSSDQAYKVLTFVGCGLSVISLLITLATYLTNKVLREKQTNKIFICLCATLLCLYISFIVMMMLDTARQECRIKDIGCGFIAGLIHYFVLSSMTWMGVEGYNTYLIIVKIFDTYIEKFMLKASVVAWGLPAVIVIVTGFSSQEKYIHKDLCFLEVTSQIGGLLIPITIIVLVNAVIFALVVRQLMKSSNVAGRVRDAKSERRETIERVQNAICILLLLGLTWISGYFLLIPHFSQIAEPIFIMLNAFQGLFIFLLYCVRKPMVRKQWGLTCLGRGHRQDTTLSSSGMHSSKNISAANTCSSSMMSSMSHSMPMEKTPMLEVLEEKNIQISNF
ncbi:adhesion G-protein coupled receptor G6-like [Lytechinus variegatus]|uniref:adhesion G-protein coupled receptor G6-like n=1 Tax=Lytechinus variegatus TaxID=7654 RepID=UPI001BB2671D|nr:adhesion G-protein coupled receptor G6-like [Lytechinus variegatus]